MGASKQRLPPIGPFLQFRRYLEAPQLGSPPLEMHRPHWGHLSRSVDHWGHDQRSPLNYCTVLLSLFIWRRPPRPFPIKSKGGLTLRACRSLTHPYSKPASKARHFLLLGGLTGNYAYLVHKDFQPGASYLHLSGPRPIFFLLLCRPRGKPWTLRLGGPGRPY